MDHPGIYVGICLVTTKVYVGSSLTCKQRIRGHYRSLKRGNHTNQYVQSAYNKYGENNFVFEIIETCSGDDRFKREQWWVNHLQSASTTFGYNQVKVIKSIVPGEVMSKFHYEYWASLGENEKHLLEPDGVRKENSERLSNWWNTREGYREKVLDGLTRGRNKTNANPTKKQLEALDRARQKAISVMKSKEGRYRQRENNLRQYADPRIKATRLDALARGRAKINARKKAEALLRRQNAKSSNDIV
jgi:group I intron endonuclease